MPYAYGSNTNTQPDPYGMKVVPRSYRAAMPRKQGQKTVPAPTFACPDCDRKFGYRVALAGHSRTHRHDKG